MTALLLSSLLLSASCAYGPKDEKSTNLSALNGENYQVQTTVLGVPIVERKVKDSVIRGRVIDKQGMFPMPVNGAAVELLDANNRVASTRTGADGTFQFTGRLQDGVYKIRVLRENKLSELDVKLNGYLADGIELNLSSKEL